MITTHINLEDKSGRVFCYKTSKLVKPRPEHYFAHCANCEYFVDSVVGKGIACAYDDGSEEDTLGFNDAVEAERYSKTQQVKQGYITQEEANDSMKGYDDEQVEELTPEEEDQQEPEQKEGVTIVTEGE